MRTTLMLLGFTCTLIAAVTMTVPCLAMGCVLLLASQSPGYAEAA
jgi:hypothetical protein